MTSQQVTTLAHVWIELNDFFKLNPMGTPEQFAEFILNNAEEAAMAQAHQEVLPPI